VRDFADRENLQAAGLGEVLPSLRLLVNDEAALLGGRWDRIVLAGVSMGAATAVHLLFNLDIPASTGGTLATPMGFSCRCPFAGRDLAGMRNIFGFTWAPDHDHVIRPTPVLLEHCADDPLVLIESGRDLWETLRGLVQRLSGMNTRVEDSGSIRLMAQMAQWTF